MQLKNTVTADSPPLTDAFGKGVTNEVAKYLLKEEHMF
jgi:hypothetical protein